MPLDIGLGIIGAILFSKVIQAPLDLNLILLGIGFALLPDLDAVWHFARNGAGKMSHEHRDLFHYPLLFTPAASLLVALVDLKLALLCAILVLLHFVHDSIGIGWGIKWWYPFSKKTYKLFSDGRAGFSWRMAIFTPEELVHVAENHGDPNWIKNIYFRITPILVTEMAVLIAALALLWIGP